MPRTTDTDEAERLRAAGQRHRAIRDYLRAAGRERRASARPVVYRVGDVSYRLLPGQRLTLPLPGVGTLTLCGEEG
jgi:hypothetical protein